MNAEAKMITFFIVFCSLFNKDRIILKITKKMLFTMLKTELN